ncbi:MAG: methyltransferase domain-containing protein [Parvularculaceae bacterium]|nr:methyltransferase domain-containing protein [Parvularculaceae bacterium]
MERAAVNFREHAFIHERVADDIVDRLETTLRRFDKALFMGPGAPILQERLTDACQVGDVTIAGESAAFLKAQGISDALEVDAARLPFADAQFELVISSMSLHAENRLPEALVEARRVLKPDGLFIASFPAGQTLSELRQALHGAEAQSTGGVGARVAPMVAIKDGGALLQRAGFALPVADTQPLRVRYQDPLRLLRDLRGMGETSTLVRGPKGALRRDVLAPAMAALSSQEILFDILVITGWAPHPSQQQPLKPGSGKVSMADAIKANIPQADD